MGEGWALSGLEAGGCGRGVGRTGRGGEGEGSVKPGGGREEVGSAKGAMGKSQCQLGSGRVVFRGGSSRPFSFPRSHSVLQQKQMLLLLSCKTQEFQVQRALGGHLFQSLFFYRWGQ